MIAPSVLPSPRLPATLGRFQIVRLLGQGAQSEVYLAFDPQLRREVALKALRGSSDTAKALLNEARAVSRLSHAAIIPVFEAAQAEVTGDAKDAGSRAYLVFEYVSGPTLAELLRQQGALVPSLAVKMLLPVLDAVAYAHANNVIHRDLKPSNILMDRRGMARVMDFGIAVRQVSGDGFPLLENTPDSDFEDTERPHALVGTPAYMAPEYVQYGRISPQMDVFSAGLILFEMLVGRRAVPGDSGFATIQFLANTDITLPATMPYPVDERLRAILARALARDPALRYAHMVDLVEALTVWSDPQSDVEGRGLTHLDSGEGQAGDGVTATVQAAALEALLRRIRLKSEFPALAESLMQINRLASSDLQNLGVLTEAVLCDVAVTQKLLRMVNSAMYRSFGGGAVSTVSRAIQLLGYAAVRTAAASLPLLPPNKDKVYTGRLLDERMLAYFCGNLARELSGLREHDAEEAFVCGSFHRLGDMLLHSYFPEEFAEIERLCQAAPRGLSASAAAAHRDSAVRQVLGLSCEALGIGVAKTWGLPEPVLRSMRAVVVTRVANGPVVLSAVLAVATPGTRTEMLRTLSAFSAELSRAWLLSGADRRQAAISVASQRYAKALALTTKEIMAGLELAATAVKSLLQGLQMDLHHSEVAHRLGLVAGPFLAQSLALSPPHSAQPEIGQAAGLATEAMLTPVALKTAVAMPQVAAVEPLRLQCREQLAAGIQDLASRLLEPFKLNALVLGVLQVLQQAAGFRQVIFCVREAKTNVLMGCIAVGSPPSGDKDPGRLRIAMDDMGDLFTATAFKGDDLWMPDVASYLQRLHADVLPAWTRKSMGATSMLLLPLHLKSQPLGMIYADRGSAEPSALQLGAKELALMGTLRNQLVLAFRQRAF